MRGGWRLKVWRMDRTPIPFYRKKGVDLVLKIGGNRIEGSIVNVNWGDNGVETCVELSFA